ncbi:excisionase family protein [Kluyvera ascorbata]|uniref:excisionase family protein n=1 Tax=Kluyvera ascorbata TaxID=51288 RepID=UPI00289CA01F|nr:excisionase family protein [Kluyvera ascorbata]
MSEEAKFLLQPNKWVTEAVLVAVTGLRSGTIERARAQSWMVGREYLHISPEGTPHKTSECMYNLDAINRWIEGQAKRQPQK